MATIKTNYTHVYIYLRIHTQGLYGSLLLSIFLSARSEVQNISKLLHTCALGLMLKYHSHLFLCRENVLGGTLYSKLTMWLCKY